MMLASCAKTNTNGQQAQEPVVRYEYGLPVDSFRIDTCVVKDGETLGGMLNRLGATRQQINGITLMPRSEFDVRTIRPGKTYYALFQTDTAGVEHLHYYIYLPNIREAVVLHLTDSMHVERFEKEITHRLRSAEVVIESSLWNAMVKNDLPAELALELSDIYAWTIDFFGLQKGDSIRVYYDEQYVDSTRIGIGRIYAADFYHARMWQEAFWFEDGNIHNYFDAEGNSLRKAFLKAPLNYKRISSKFTYARKHPVYKVVRPHTGVDYAAPAGTPVVSIGDGVVTMKHLVILVRLNVVHNVRVETDKGANSPENLPFSILSHSCVLRQPPHLVRLPASVEDGDVKVFPILLPKLVEEGLNPADAVQRVKVEKILVFHN